MVTAAWLLMSVAIILSVAQAWFLRTPQAQARWWRLMERRHVMQALRRLPLRRRLAAEGLSLRRYVGGLNGWELHTVADICRSCSELDRCSAVAAPQRMAANDGRCPNEASVRRQLAD